MSYGLVLVPVISAFIGWLANRILIQMLFHPREPKKIAGLVLQGIFPKKQQQLAEKLGKLVSNELFSVAEIEQKVNSPENFQKIMPLMEEHIDTFLRVKLPKQMPMIGMFIGDKTINELKAVFITELKELFPVVMKNYMSGLQEEFDIKKMVTGKMAALSPVKLEGIIKSSLRKEFRYIGIIGATTGFLIGLLQVLLVIWG